MLGSCGGSFSSPAKPLSVCHVGLGGSKPCVRTRVLTALSDAVGNKNREEKGREAAVLVQLMLHVRLGALQYRIRRCGAFRVSAQPPDEAPQADRQCLAEQVWRKVASASLSVRLV